MEAKIQTPLEELESKVLPEPSPPVAVAADPQTATLKEIKRFRSDGLDLVVYRDGARHYLMADGKSEPEGVWLTHVEAQKLADVLAFYLHERGRCAQHHADYIPQPAQEE